MTDTEFTPLVPDADELKAADDATLESFDVALRTEEAKTREAMAPWESRMTKIRGERQLIATERRRRERAALSARRKEVRANASSGEMPHLLDAIASLDLGDETPLRDVKAFLVSGGAVGFGFPTRPGTIAFTNGREQKAATTWGEARQFYLDGWEPGSPAISGVRVHLAGTRVERVVAPTDVVISPGV